MCKGGECSKTKQCCVRIRLLLRDCMRSPVVMVTFCQIVNNKNKIEKRLLNIRFVRQSRFNWNYWKSKVELCTLKWVPIWIRMADTANGRYKYLQKIGEGIHGMVLKAHDLTTDRLVAIKKVSLRTKYGDISLSTVREIKALQHCDCKYVSTNHLWHLLILHVKPK